MKCPHCKDEGRVVLAPDDKRHYPMVVPCPECQGSRIVYCCEGEVQLPCDVEPKD